MSLQMMNRFQALLSYLDGETVAEYEEAPDDNAGALLFELFTFTQYPVSSWLVQTIYQNTFDAPFDGVSGWRFLEPEPRGVLDVDNSMSLVVPESATPYGVREVVKATTDTNGVDVFGFASVSNIVKKAISEGDIGAVNIDCQFMYTGWCMGASSRSGLPYYSLDSQDLNAYFQILLEESDYTQAMADNDNIIEESAGGLTTQFKVVGIWKKVVV